MPNLFERWLEPDLESEVPPRPAGHPKAAADELDTVSNFCQFISECSLCKRLSLLLNSVINLNVSAFIIRCNCFSLKCVFGINQFQTISKCLIIIIFYCVYSCPNDFFRVQTRGKVVSVVSAGPSNPLMMKLIKRACSGIQILQDSSLGFLVNRLNLTLGSLTAGMSNCPFPDDHHDFKYQRTVILLTFWHMSQVHIIYLRNTATGRFLTKLVTTENLLFPIFIQKAGYNIFFVKLFELIVVQ